MCLLPNEETKKAISVLDNPRSVANSRYSLGEFAFTKLRAPNARAGRAKETVFMMFELAE